MKAYGIGILGFGTVGAGVVEGLLRNGDLMAARLGARPELRAVADPDLERDRGVALAPGLLTADAEAVVDDPRVDFVVETIGGKGVARALITRALERGKPVVTANKALLAEHGPELFALAAAHHTEIYFGASVGGGIPIIRALREGLVANRIESISGILNGTCNYILTRMAQEGLPFDTVLKDAQQLGYAEANPAFDVDGIDTAHKAALLAWLAYGAPVPLDAIAIEGIRHLAAEDIRYGANLGYRVKLLAVIKQDAGGGVEVRVHPTMVPHTHPLASVDGVFNAAMVMGDLTGPTLYYGRGAGRAPTASTVLGDLGDLIKNMQAGGPRRFHGAPPAAPLALARPADSLGRYYLRLALRDRPGTLARITAVLGAHAISIASVMQQEGGANDYVPVVIVTHQARAGECEAALRDIARLDEVQGEPVRIRIED